ncbi:short-chain dehydrogenase [Ferrigenium kumadai]|uniref:Short-chain dehydrogenase n=1 Tax=Ferrigenium kumadai TaxID=1682490 RepID=A0AAN1T1L8_9PROT|nr:SDR family NAD(P)-dependent oxidoreductase [Ferrigenium kumadai]BBJ00351.1 short-chain dehydrogenase [Ferrigenium kumadai]
MGIILVTGATDGIGFETTRELATLGHEVVVHGRSEEKARHARDAIQDAAPKAVLHLAHADLTDPAAIQRMAQDLLSRLPHLDVLVNNAGVYMNEFRLTRDGFEMTLAVNYLAPFLLTNLLLPLLKRSDEPRVVTVASIAHQSGRIPFDNLNSERHFDGYHAYANSKLAVALFAAELARREPWLASNSLHPGVIGTKLLHAGFDMKGAPVTEGAQTPVFLATSPAVKGMTGKYFDRCTAVRPSALAEDEQLAQQLWEWTAKALRPWLPV